MKKLYLFLIAIMLLSILACGVGNGSGEEPDGGGDGDGSGATEEVTDEPESTSTYTPVPIDTAEPTATFTPTATPTDTPIPTNTPTSTPTYTPTVVWIPPTNTPLPTATYTPSGPFCGDGACTNPPEDTISCPADCQCVNNGICEPAERENCPDCQEPTNTPEPTQELVRDANVEINNKLYVQLSIQFQGFWDYYTIGARSSIIVDIPSGTWSYCANASGYAQYCNTDTFDPGYNYLEFFDPSNP